MSAFLLGVILFASQALANQAGSLACSAIQSQLGVDIAETPFGPGFNASTAQPQNLVNSVLVPACVVTPQNTAQVSTAMKAIFKYKSRYAVLSGGHSAMKGWNSVDGGVLIYFRDMAAATYDPKEDTITMQPGIRWIDAINALEPFGVAPVGGRAGDVGTGFFLGGGISFLSPSRGWGADNIKEVDVVLVNGDVVTASAQKNADLFQALKGGANRFGIVTRYELYPYHSGNDKSWFGGFIAYPASSVEAVVKASAHFAQNVQDPKATIFSTLVFPVVNGTVSTFVQVFMFYNGDKMPENVFGELLSIPSTTVSLGPTSYADIVRNTFPVNEDHSMTYMYGSSVISGKDENAHLNVLHTNLAFTEKFKESLANTALTFTPIPQSQIAASRARGPNSLGTPTGGYSVITILQNITPGIVEVPDNVRKGKAQLLAQNPPTPGLPLFLNECDQNQNVFATYGNYEALKATYKKYDPERFNVQFTDGPLGL